MESAVTQAYSSLSHGKLVPILTSSLLVTGFQMRRRWTEALSALKSHRRVKSRGGPSASAGMRVQSLKAHKLTPSICSISNLFLSCLVSFWSRLVMMWMTMFEMGSVCCRRREVGGPEGFHGGWPFPSRGQHLYF